MSEDKPRFFVIKTVKGRENAVLDNIMESRLRDSIIAVLIPATLHGYIFIETEDPATIVSEFPKFSIKTRLISQVQFKDIEEFIIKYNF